MTGAVTRAAVTRAGLREEPAGYLGPPAAATSGGTSTEAFPESTLTALWLLGRVPSAALPYVLLRPGRAGRGPGPDVREATLLLPSGVPLTGDVEVHLRASDFVRHGHGTDAAYAGVILHLCWNDDRPEGERGRPTPLPGGGEAPTVALATTLRTPSRVEALVARGPSGREPCGDLAQRRGAEAAAALVRSEGRRRLAERAWRAWRLADRHGVGGAFRMLLERAIASTAGRVRESPERQDALLATIEARLAAGAVTTGPLDAEPPNADPLDALERLAREGRPSALIGAFQVEGVGRARAAEVAWNAALPLLTALAAAYEDTGLARATAALADAWPAPRPYGRTRTLAGLVGPPPRPGGALYAQGLLHLQDLWCTRGGCGACPLSRRESDRETHEARTGAD